MRVNSRDFFVNKKNIGTKSNTRVKGRDLNGDFSKKNLLDQGSINGKRLIVAKIVHSSFTKARQQPRHITFLSDVMMI